MQLLNKHVQVWLDAPYKQSVKWHAKVNQWNGAIDADIGKSYKFDSIKVNYSNKETSKNFSLA